MERTLHPIVEAGLRRIVDRAGTDLSALAGRTVVITGAAGFLTSHVVDALAWANRHRLEADCSLVCVDNFITGVPERLEHLEGRSDVRFVRADVIEQLEVGESADYVLHGASIASPTWYRRFPLETIDVNVIGTRRALELARERGARLLFLSSSEIYGDPPPEWIPTPETYWGNVSPTGPRAPYDESKRLGETLCATYHRQYGTDVVVVRPFNVYGPRLRLDDGRVIPDFLSDALAGAPITLLSDGSPTRSFCYVEDFVTALLLLLLHGQPGEAYNVGNDEEVTMRRAAEVMAEIAGVPGVAAAESDDPQYLVDNPSRRCPDLAKARGAIAWRPEVPLAEGLARTFAYYRDGGRG